MIGFHTEAAALDKAVELSAAKLGNYFSVIVGWPGVGPFCAVVVRGSPTVVEHGQRLAWRCINGRSFPVEG